MRYPILPFEIYIVRSNSLRGSYVSITLFREVYKIISYLLIIIEIL